MHFQIRARNVFPDSPNSVHSDLGAQSIGLPAAVVPGVVLYGLMASGDAPATHALRFRRPTFEAELLDVERGSEGGSVTGPDGTTRATLEVSNAGDAPLFDEQAGNLMRPVEIDLDEIERAIRPAVDTDAGARHAALLDAVHHFVMRNLALNDPWLHAGSTLRLRDTKVTRVIASGSVARTYVKKDIEFMEVHVILHSMASDPVMQVVHTIVPKPKKR